MSEEQDYSRRLVTNAELKAELDKLPTRWEVRFLIVIALLVNQFVPAADIARAMFQ